MNLKDFLVIAACILALAIAIIADNSKPGARVSTPTQVDRKTEPDNNPNTDKAMLVTYCELAIKPQLKNPKSMKLDWHQTAMAEMSTGQLGVRMYYYAENSFGATPLSIVNCLFDTDGNLLEYKQVQ